MSKAWNDPIQLKATKDTLSLGLRVHYWLIDQALGMGQKGAGLLKTVLPEKGQAREAVSRVQAVLEWDKTWHMESRLFFPPSDNQKPDLEQVNEIVKHMGLDKIRENADRFGKGLKEVSDFQPRAKEVWENIQSPIFLEKGIWLLIRPEKVRVKTPHLDPLHPQTMQTVFELSARPEILFGKEPPVVKSPLPPLLPYQKGPGGFHALSNIRITYAEGTQLLKDLNIGLFGHVFKETGDRRVTIKNIRLYGSGGKAVAEVKMQYNPILNLNLEAKPADLTVYLRGTPRYLPKKRIFDLPDLDFDIKSSDFLVEVAQWFFKDSLRKELRKKARINLGPKLDQLKKQMDQAFNLTLGPTAKLSTVVSGLSVLDAYADNEGLVARVALDGTANLFVTWK